jgi:hypothetical protein
MAIFISPGQLHRDLQLHSLRPSELVGGCIGREATTLLRRGGESEEVWAEMDLLGNYHPSKPCRVPILKTGGI